MNNLALVRPSEEHIPEIQAYRDECRAHDTHSHGESGLYECDDIPTWVNLCRSSETLPQPGHVAASQFMLMREGESRIYGMISLRHSLNGGYLAEHGGHIGYGVRPTERRKGYAKAMLKLCLEEARDLGLSKVLICCDLDNAGSRGAIKACGGQFERLAITGAEVDERYWISLDNNQEQTPHQQNETEPATEVAPLDNYYAARNEEDRLKSRHGLVEYLTTMRYVEEYLTKGARVIEIGAGTGRYSRTIADMSHKVEAVEPMSTNIEIFRQNLKPSQDINITQANALDLSKFASNSFDIALLLGPLYHLYTDSEKHQAIAEAIRITKPGGVIFAAYCLSDASIALSGFGRSRFSVKEYMRLGLIDPATFATTSRLQDIFELVRKEDIDRIMAPFAVERLHYVATDLFSHWIREGLAEMDDETYALYLRYHFAICERPDIVGASHHSLDIFRKN